MRRRIVEFLGEKGNASFSDFKETLNVRVGTLYYHFDVLGRLISQDEQKRYVLTGLGKKAYELTRAEEGKWRSPETGAIVPPSGIGGYVRNFILPSKFLSYTYRNQKIGIVLALITMAIGALVSFQARLQPILFFFDRASPNQEFLIPLELVGSWLGIFVITDILAVVIFKRKGDEQLLLVGTAFSFAPLILFPAIALLIASLRLGPSFLVDSAAARALLVILQSWSFVILTQAVAVCKGLGLEKSVILALVVAYFNIMILFVLGRVG